MNKPEIIIYLILFVSTAVIISRHAIGKGRAKSHKINRFNKYKKRNRKWQ